MNMGEFHHEISQCFPGKFPKCRVSPMMRPQRSRGSVGSSVGTTSWEDEEVGKFSDFDAIAQASFYSLPSRVPLIHETILDGMTQANQLNSV